MRPNCTFGGQPARRYLTLPDLRQAKAQGRKLTQANATRDVAEEAAAVAASGIDILSVTSLRHDKARAAAPRHDIIATGGVGAIGRTADEALAILHDVRRLESAGAVAVDLECVAEAAAAAISQRTTLITLGFGSGQGTDVVFLFTADICGDTPTLPRHAKAFGTLPPLRAALDAERRRAPAAFAGAESDSSFPNPATSIAMPPERRDKLAEALDRLRPLHE